MSSIVVLEWEFSTPNYFEESIEILCHDYTITIANGEAQVKSDSAIFEANPSMRQVMHDTLNDMFLGVQLVEHRFYGLSNSTMTRVHPDGREDFFIECEPGHFVMSAGTVNIQITDKNGNVITDTKRDRIERERSLAELITTYRANDSLVASLVGSYNAAVRDASNELVYLYEIPEALYKRFGDKAAAQAALDISSTQWSRMRCLCCDARLKQGRHRGQNIAALRDASEGELSEARGIALAMIEVYLHHL